MAKSAAARKAAAKRARKAFVPGARRSKKIKMGGKRYGCHVRRIKAFGRKAKVARAFCAVIKKAK